MTSAEFQERLIGRAESAGIELQPPLPDQLEAYYRLLARWNSKVNLTALSLDPVTDHAIERLLLEPLAALPLMSDLQSPIWFDIGSGGGSPAIPINLARPDFRLTMVESRERKAAFLREAVRILGLERASVEARRLEDLAPGHRLMGAIDLVTIRAVRIDSALFEALRLLVRLDGQVILFGTKPDVLTAPEGFDVGEPSALPAFKLGDIAVLKRSHG